MIRINLAPDRGSAAKVGFKGICSVPSFNLGLLFGVLYLARPAIGVYWWRPDERGGQPHRRRRSRSTASCRRSRRTLGQGASVKDLAAECQARVGVLEDLTKGQGQSIVLLEPFIDTVPPRSLDHQPRAEGRRPVEAQRYRLLDHRGLRLHVESSSPPGSSRTSTSSSPGRPRQDAEPRDLRGHLPVRGLIWRSRRLCRPSSTAPSSPRSSSASWALVVILAAALLLPDLAGGSQAPHRAQLVQRQSQVTPRSPGPGPGRRDRALPARDRRARERAWRCSRTGCRPRRRRPPCTGRVSDGREQVGLGVSLFQPRAALARDVVSEIPITVTAEGSYHQLAKFFERVAGLPRVVNVNDFKLTGLRPIAKNSMRADLTLATYMYRSPRPAPAEPAPQTAPSRRRRCRGQGRPLVSRASRSSAWRLCATLVACGGAVRPRRQPPKPVAAGSPAPTPGAAGRPGRHPW